MTSKHRKTATDDICQEKLNSLCLFWKRISVFVFLFWVGVGLGWRVRHVTDYEPLNALLDRRCRFCSWALQHWNCKHQGYSLPHSPTNKDGDHFKLWPFEWNYAKIRQEEWTSFCHNPSSEEQPKWEPNIKHISDVLTSGRSCRHFAPLELCVCGFIQQDK